MKYVTEEPRIKVKSYEFNKPEQKHAEAKRTPVISSRFIVWAAAAFILAVVGVVIALTSPGGGKDMGSMYAVQTQSTDPASANSANPDPTLNPTSPPESKAPPVTVASVILSINPSVEIALGEDGMVISVTGLNEDGTALVAGIDFAGLSLENATIIVVDLLIQNNYICASMVDDVFISVNGTFAPDTLAMMGEIITTAASTYEIDVDTIETGENELQVVVGEPDEPKSTEEPEETESPGPSYDVPAIAKIKIEKQFGDAGRVFLYTESGKRLDDKLDSAGMSLLRSVYLCMAYFTEDGYIRPGKQGSKIEFDLSEFDSNEVTEAEALIRLLAEEFCPPFEVERSGAKVALVSTGQAAERTAKYTLYEIEDAMLIKQREYITELQMQILNMVYTQDEIDFLLLPRYFVVMPNIMGLSEDKAVELLEMLELKPQIAYDSGTRNWWTPEEYAAAENGTVLYQDPVAGCIAECGERISVIIKTGSDIPLLSGDLSPEVYEYMPTFLDESGYYEFEVNKADGMGLAFTLKQEGWEVELNTYGGSIKNSGGSLLHNDDLLFNNDPDNPYAYWTADEGDGFTAKKANIYYYIRKDGEYIACAAVSLRLLSDDGSVLKFSARPLAFGIGGPYCIDALYRFEVNNP